VVLKLRDRGFTFDGNTASDMGKPIGKRIPWGHITLWSLYLFGIELLPFYRHMANYVAIQWCQLLYVITVQMAVFYAVGHFAGKWFARYYHAFLLEDSCRGQLALLMKRPVLAVLLINVAYLTVTLALGDWLFGTGGGGPLLRAKNAQSGIATFVLAGIAYAMIRWPGPQSGGDDNGPGDDAGPPLIRYRVVGPYRGRVTEK
jgi:hypothetical protein